MVIYFSPDLVPDFEDVWPSRQVLEVVGLDTEFCYALIDGTVLAVGESTTGHLYLFPLAAQEQDERPEPTLIANVVAFLAETPVLLVPREEATLHPWPVEGIQLPSARLFWKTQRDALEVAVGLRWSHHLAPILPWDASYGGPSHEVGGMEVSAVDLSRFKRAADALSLYALSLRQIDAFAEYVFLYRLFEYVSNANGTRWIADRLASVADLDVGPSFARFDGLYGGVTIPERYVGVTNLEAVRVPGWRDDVVDLSGVMRGMAVARAQELLGLLDAQQVAQRLYADQRCGLAHAGTTRSFLLHDRAADVEDVLADLPLVRFLARAAVIEATHR